MVAMEGEDEADAMVVVVMMLMCDSIERPVGVLLAIVVVLASILVVLDTVPAVDDAALVVVLLSSVVVGKRSVVEPVVRVLVVVRVLAKVDADCRVRPQTLLLVDVALVDREGHGNVDVEVDLRVVARVLIDDGNVVELTVVDLVVDVSVRIVANSVPVIDDTVTPAPVSVAAVVLVLE